MNRPSFARTSQPRFSSTQARCRIFSTLFLISASRPTARVSSTPFTGPAAATTTGR
ncbi:hypothetical protein [Streptomyces sp. NPDC001020]